MLVSSILLLAFTMNPELLAGNVWPIYGVVFLGGLARSSFRPAVVALAAEVIPRAAYSNAVAWRTSMWHLAAVAGPAAGGVIYGFSGPSAAYVTVIVLMVASFAAATAVRHRGSPPLAEEVPLAESLKIGIRFVIHEPVLLAAMTLDLFSVLFGGATALLPIFASMLRVGPQGLGVLRAAPAIGSIVTSTWIAHRPPMKRAGLSLLVAVTLYGMAIIAFALSRNFYLSFVLLLFSGSADAVSVVIRGTLLQSRTPDALIGRVSAVNQVFISASNEIGAFESGLAARLLGTVPSVIFGGLMTLVVVVLTAWRSPQLRKLKQLELPSVDFLDRRVSLAPCARW
jgi:predicted MFS family arabinose efflux permease